MRYATLIFATFITGALGAPAWALQPGDPMRAWKRASADERAKLLTEILGKADAGVSRCMDETSAAPGHADLPIAEIAKACASTKGAGEPV